MEHDMAKPRKETPKRRLIRLIATAFRAAEIGEEGDARRLMNMALKSGAILDPRTETGFELAIKKGLRDTRA